MTEFHRYQLEQASWILQFSSRAVETLSRHAQSRVRAEESVGQLYTRDLTTACVEIEVATLLKPTWTTWTRVRFNKTQAEAEREAMFHKGLHCVGLWHTHPELQPSPSAEDRALAREHASAAKPQLAGLVFAIVGTLPFPTGLQVWVDDGTRLLHAKPILVDTA